MKKTLAKADLNLNNDVHHKFKEMSEGKVEKEIKEAKDTKVTEDPKAQNETKETGKTTPPVTKPIEPAPPAKNPLIDDNPNIIIKDYISGKVILAKKVNFAGKSVADATLEVLDTCNISVGYRGGYFSMIAGLKEKDAGDNSGWLYYVDGKVPLSIGASGYKLNGNEKIEWKYFKDALNPAN